MYCFLTGALDQLLIFRLLKLLTAFLNPIFPLDYPLWGTEFVFYFPIMNILYQFLSSWIHCLNLLNVLFLFLFNQIWRRNNAKSLIYADVDDKKTNQNYSCSKMWKQKFYLKTYPLGWVGQRGSNANVS